MGVGALFAAPAKTVEANAKHVGSARAGDAARTDRGADRHIQTAVGKGIDILSARGSTLVSTNSIPSKERPDSKQAERSSITR
eukprot:4436656-Prymnesium_polylepis.1